MSPPIILPSQPLGMNGPQVPRIGVGLMNLSMFSSQSIEEKLAVYDAAWSRGQVFWDTGAPFLSSLQILMAIALTQALGGRVGRLRRSPR